MRRWIPMAAVVAMLVTALPAAADEEGGAAGALVEGTVARLAVDGPAGGHVVTLVVTDAGDVVRVQPEALAATAGGVRVRVEVSGAAATSLTDPAAGAEVLGVETVAPPAGREVAAATEVISGNRPVALLVGGLPGQSTVGLTTAPARDGIEDFASPYWSDSTGGQITFTVTDQLLAGTFDEWGDTTTCTDEQVWALLEWTGIRHGGVSRLDTGTHAVFHTPYYAGCDFRAVSQLGDGGSVWLNGPTRPIGPLLGHELGHTLTLGDSHTRVGCARPAGVEVADGTAEECYDGWRGDSYDIMGAQPDDDPGALSGAHLDALGLLPAADTVTAAGTTDTVLQPVSGLTGTRFIRFAAGDTTYYVEYRGAVLRDQALQGGRWTCPLGTGDLESPTDPCEELQVQVGPGVVIRRVDESDGPGKDSFLLDAPVENPAFDPDVHGWFVLPTGFTFAAASGLMTVKVVSVTAAGARVVVTAAERPVDQMVMTRDITGDGRADVFTVDAGGRLFLLPGLGNGRLAALRNVGPGWGEMRVFAPGDWNGDGRSDLVAADAAGDLWMYPGNGAGGLGGRVKIGNGWNGFRIVPAGDMNGDRRADLMAIDPQGRLWLYPGAGLGKFARRVQVGNGWTGFELYAAGDANRDGRQDILSIDSAGKLWYYAGKGGGYFAMRRQVGNGWTGFTFASGADLNRDGLGDLLGRDPSGALFFYPGRLGGGFGSRVKVATGW